MRIFGHPLHVILVAFPLGLLSLTPAWDVLAWFGFRGAHFAAYYAQIAGLGLGTLAVITGFMEFIRTKKSAAADALALRHAGAALSALSIFGLALALRSRDHTASVGVIALESLGALVLGLTGWFGGQLVFEHGVGVAAERSEDREALPK